MSEEGKSGRSNIPPGHVEIVEGTAKMLYDQKEAVFYNKVQVLNRDLSIQVIKLFSEVVGKERKDKYQNKLAIYNARKAAGKLKEGVDDREPFRPPDGITILDALAATGLRSVRYAKEIPQLRHILINDLLPEATAVAVSNCRTNGVPDDLYTVHNRDACILMYEHRDPLQQFDVVDLDPYGTASPFLDGAVQSVADGGLLCVTCTDLAVLSGNYPEVCFAKYGSMPVKAKYCHEMALRILLNSIESAANRYKRYIVPWLSLSVDFYVRVFVRVFESPSEVKNSCLKRINVFQSTQCPSFYVQPVAIRKNTKKQIQEEKAKRQQQGEEEGEGEALASPGGGQKGSHSLNGGNVEASAPQKQQHPPQGNYTGVVLQVPGQKCPDSGGWLKAGGPFWGAPMHDQAVVDQLLQRVKDKRAQQQQLLKQQHPDQATSKSTNNATTSTSGSSSGSAASVSRLDSDSNPIPTADRLVGILTSMSEELKDVPFYYSLPDLASTVQVTVPTHVDFKTALLRGGYRASQFHHDPSAMKTDAPHDVVWDIMRAYCKIHKPEQGRTRKKMSEVATRILSKEPVFIADFTPSKELLGTREKVARFQPNPEANWGPKRRAGRLVKEPEKDVEKDVDNDSAGADGSRGGGGAAAVAAAARTGEEEPVEKKKRTS